MALVEKQGRVRPAGVAVVDGFDAEHRQVGTGDAGGGRCGRCGMGTMVDFRLVKVS